MSTDDQQWIDARRPWVDITSGESVVAELAIPRILAEYVEWKRGNPLSDPYIIAKAHNPFRIHDNDSLVYTSQDGREYLIEIKAFLLSEDPYEIRRQQSADARQRDQRRIAETDFRVGLLTQE